MPLSRSDKARLLLGLSLVAPMLTVQGLRFALADAKAAAPVAADLAAGAPDAAFATPEMVALLAPPRPLNAAQTRAAEYLATRTRSMEVASPMDHATLSDPHLEIEEVASSDMPGENPKPPSPTEDPDPASSLVVSAIFADRTMSRVTINNSLRKVGDEVALGWTVAEIDGKRRVVVLRSRSGRAIEIGPSR